MGAEGAVRFKSLCLHISGYYSRHREQEGHPGTPALAFHSTGRRLGEMGDRGM